MEINREVLETLLDLAIGNCGFSCDEGMGPLTNEEVEHLRAAAIILGGGC